MSNIYNSLLNKKQEDLIITATVNTLTPMTVKLYPDDEPIPVKTISSLLNLQIGSNVFMIRYNSTFVIIGVINTPFNYPKLILKTADKSITSSNTLQNDNHLLATLEAGFIYEIDVNLYIIASTTGDFKSLISLGGSASFNLGTVYTNRYSRGGGTTTTSVTNATAVSTTVLSMETYPTTTYAYGGTGGSSYGNNINEKILISTLSGSGTITLQWAQAVSDGTATIVKKGSYMKITPVFL